MIFFLVCKNGTYLQKHVILPIFSSLSSIDCTMYPCENCEFVGTQNNALKKHISANHKGILLSCSQCSYITENKAKYNRHLDVHEDPKFACHLCDKKLREKSTLKKHIFLCHENKKILTCDICAAVFEKSDQLKVHKETHLLCTLCNTVFSRTGNLNQHLKTTHSEKNFQCNSCNQYYSRAWSLKKHIMTHSEDKPFQCQDCDKSFNNGWYIV